MFNAPFFNGIVRLDEPMANHTTMRVGGRAPIFLEPSDEESLIFAVKVCIESDVKFFIIGGGSNIVMADNVGFAIISTKQFKKVSRSKTPGKAKGLFALATKHRDESNMDESGVEKKKRYLNCDAGATWTSICMVCTKNNLRGFEQFAGLPGTVGGATYINATCFGLSTCDNLVSVRYLDLKDMEVKTYKKNPDDWGYKSSPFQTTDKIVLTVEFEVLEDSSLSLQELKNGYHEFVKKRALMKHFESPSAGSVFRNQPGSDIIAGKVIDECGLKGTRVGGAMVADFHGNFIINENHATAADVRELVRLVQEKVKAEKNIDLQCEIIFVPENVDI